MGKDSYISNVSFHNQASPMSILWKGLVWKEEGILKDFHALVANAWSEGDWTRIRLSLLVSVPIFFLKVLKSMVAVDLFILE